MVFDGHSDLLYDVTRRRLAGERRVLERHHLPRLKEGGIEGLVLAIWANPVGGESWECRERQMLRCLEGEFAESTHICRVQTAAQAAAAKARGDIYAFLAVEGMDAIGEELSRIDRYAALGVRLGMLTWNGENALATGAGGDPGKGLTSLGRQAIRQMERRHILPDLSHLNAAGAEEVLRVAEGKVIASHSNSRALCDAARNLSDDQLRRIRDTGGVVGVNAYHAFVHTDPEKQTVEMLARHAAHMAEVMGVSHVACGFDFCEYFGPGNESVRGMEDCSQTGEFFYWLEKLGMSPAERQMIARENFLRVLA